MPGILLPGIYFSGGIKCIQDKPIPKLSFAGYNLRNNQTVEKQAFFSRLHNASLYKTIINFSHGYNAHPDQ